MSYNYFISGLITRSDHPLSSDLEVEEGLTLQPQVEIEVAGTDDDRVPKQTVSKNGFSFSAIDGLFFTISEGRKITIFKDARITDTDVTLYLLGSAWGVLCHQRGLLPLHCSAVSNDSGAYMFVADSGGGKSTLAASLCVSGTRHVCDDVAIVKLDKESGVVIHAMPKGLKLWQESTAVLGLEKRSLAAKEGSRLKHYVVPPKGPDDVLLDLRAIYEIQFSDESAEPSIERLTGVAPLMTVYRNIYRVEWLGLLEVSERSLNYARKIAEKVPVYRFTRPKDLTRLSDSSALMLDHINQVSKEFQ